MQAGVCLYLRGVRLSEAKSPGMRLLNMRGDLQQRAPSAGARAPDLAQPHSERLAAPRPCEAPALQQRPPQIQTGDLQRHGDRPAQRETENVMYAGCVRSVGRLTS